MESSTRGLKKGERFTCFTLIGQRKPKVSKDEPRVSFFFCYCEYCKSIGRLQEQHRPSGSLCWISIVDHCLQKDNFITFIKLNFKKRSNYLFCSCFCKEPHSLLACMLDAILQREFFLYSARVLDEHHTAP